jgi:hypothetical protein
MAIADDGQTTFHSKVRSIFFVTILLAKQKISKHSIQGDDSISLANLNLLSISKLKDKTKQVLTAFQFLEQPRLSYDKFHGPVKVLTASGISERG